MIRILRRFVFHDTCSFSYNLLLLYFCIVSSIMNYFYQAFLFVPGICHFIFTIYVAVRRFYFFCNYVIVIFLQLLMSFCLMGTGESSGPYTNEMLTRSYLQCCFRDVEFFEAENI